MRGHILFVNGPNNGMVIAVGVLQSGRFPDDIKKFDEEGEVILTYVLKELVDRGNTQFFYICEGDDALMAGALAKSERNFKSAEEKIAELQGQVTALEIELFKPDNSHEILKRKYQATLKLIAESRGTCVEREDRQLSKWIGGQ